VALVSTAVITSALALLVRSNSDASIEAVMFSGQEGMAEILTLTSVSTVLLVVVAKLIAYGFALGSGFRGGPIFPAVFLGVATATGLTLVFPSLSLTAMVVAGIAASTAAALKLPFTSALLALLIVAGAGMDIAPFAIIGAVLGLIVRLALDRTGLLDVPSLETSRSP
jgi:H+/Cl- antiporter ClcA